MTYRGLVSDEHPILQAFVARLPRAGAGADRLQTGHAKNQAVRGDSKLLALDSEYVTANERMRGLIRVDLDADFATFAAIEVACDAAGVPRPSIIVGHRRQRDGAILHPHAIWILEAAVCFTGRGRSAPRALWHRVSRGLTHALAGAGADPGALANPMRVKAATCPLWARHVAADRPYSLRDLANCVRMNVTREDLERGRPSELPRSECVRVDPGSNSLFLSLREFGRAQVAARRAVGGTIEEWRHELATLALTLADDERLGACPSNG